MNHPRIDAPSQRFVPEGMPFRANELRGQMRHASYELRQGRGDADAARQLLVEGERLKSYVAEGEAEALDRCMGELRAALPPEPDRALGLDRDVAVTPGSSQRELEWQEGVTPGLAFAELVTHGGAELTAHTVAHVLHMAGGVVTCLALLWDAYEIVDDLTHAMADGTRDGLLGAAFGGLGGGSPGWAAGISSSLRGLRADERAALRDALPNDMDRERFDEAFEVASRARTEQPEAFAEAREKYMEAFHSFTDGYAAGIEGWSAQDRGEGFAAGRELAARALREPGGRTLRAEARAIKIEGFRDAMAGQVDHHRYDNDAHYRSGVNHHRHTAAHGLKAVEAEWNRLENQMRVPAHGTTGAHVRG